MEKRKIILTRKQVEMLAESEMAKLKKEDIESMIGDPEDRKVSYPSPAEIEAIKTGQTLSSDDDSDTINPSDMKSPPHELLGYLDKLEEAKSILSKVAAKEDDDNIKNRIYAHYEKAQKLAFEMIKEFGIVH
jgi:vacuolar-type H+-ATPase subunit B/Vma2